MCNQAIHNHYVIMVYLQTHDLILTFIYTIYWKKFKKIYSVKWINDWMTKWLCVVKLTDNMKHAKKRQLSKETKDKQGQCKAWCIPSPKNLTLWPWKSIGFQILLRTKYVPSLVKIHWRMLILECSQGCYGRTDGSVTISLCNFVGEGIKKQNKPWSTKHY
jgi:hypothetical protein